MSNRALALVLVLAFGGCAPPPEPAETSGPPTNQDAAPAAVNEHAVIQGRLELGGSGKATEAWLDVEVDGPSDDALAVCGALLEQERARPTHADPRVAAVVGRPCSDKALAPPPVTAPFALLQNDKLDAIELALELGPRAEGKSLQALTVRRTVLSGFSDKASCDATLARIAADKSQSVAQASQAAKSFLSAELDRQRSIEQKACAAPASTECTKSHEITTLLEQKLGDANVDQPGVSDPNGASASCYRR